MVGVGNGLKRMRILGLVIGLGLVGGAALRGEDDVFVRDVQPLLKQHCLECHRGAKTKGGVNLAAFTNTASLYANPKLWETSVRQIEDRQMPPKDEEQPAEAARIKLAETLTHLLDNPAPEFVVRDPGA